jgi:hypothetical protein
MLNHFVNHSVAKAALLILLCVSVSVTASGIQFPTLSGPTEVLPKTFAVEVSELKPTTVFYTISEHNQVFIDHLASAEERALYIRDKAVSSAHPLFAGTGGNRVARFVNPLMPAAYLRHTSYWENVWSEGYDQNQKTSKSLKVTIGSKSTSVNAFTQVVADVKIDVVKASASASSTVTQQINSYTTEEEREESQVIEIVTGPDEKVQYTMWQRIDVLEIVDKYGNKIVYDGLWQIFEDGHPIWQSTGKYVSPAPVIIRGQRFLNRAKIPE